MVVATDILMAFITALIFSLLLVVLLRRRGPGPMSGLLFFFLVLFFSVWALGVWLTPFGPSLLGRTWLVFVVAGALCALFLLALVPPSQEREALDLRPAQEKRAIAATQAAFGLLFWLLIAVLIAAIFTRYIWWVT